jgi:integrase
VCCEHLRCDPPWPTQLHCASAIPFVTCEEYAAIADKLEPHMRAVWTYLTGWRVTEALALRWEHVDAAAGVIRFTEQGASCWWRAMPVWLF